MHILSGAVIGIALAHFSIERIPAYIIALLLLIFWEVFEVFFSIIEERANRVIDIVVGFVGFTICFEIFVGRFSPDAQFAVLVFSIILLAMLSLLGWLDYRDRVSH